MTIAVAEDERPFGRGTDHVGKRSDVVVLLFAKAEEFMNSERPGHGEEDERLTALRRITIFRAMDCRSMIDSPRLTGRLP